MQRCVFMMYFGPIVAWGSKVMTTIRKTHGASRTPFYEFKIRWRSIFTSSELYAFLYGLNSSNSTADYEIDYQRMRTYFLLLGTIVSGQRLNLCQREINEERFSEINFDHLWVQRIPLIFFWYNHFDFRVVKETFGNTKDVHEFGLIQP